MTDPYGAAPRPAPQTSDDNTWALAAHLGALLASMFVGLALLAPLIIMLVKSDSPYVRRHAVESRNFQISALIYVVVGAVLSVVLAVVTFGIGLVVVIPLAIAAGIAWLVLVIVASVRASKGEDYRYPLTIRFVS